LSLQCQENEDIRKLLASDSDGEAAAAFLLRARGAFFYTHGDPFQQNKERIIQILNTAKKDTYSSSEPMIRVYSDRATTRGI
jgi:hypothetical protein